MKKTIVILLFFLLTCRLAAQTVASVSLLTVNDGLSQGMVFDILQSRDGFLWLGIKGGGLNRLDKKTNQFKQYKIAEGLPDNVVYGILAEEVLE